MAIEARNPEFGAGTPAAVAVIPLDEVTAPGAAEVAEVGTRRSCEEDSEIDDAADRIWLPLLSRDKSRYQSTDRLDENLTIHEYKVADE